MAEISTYNTGLDTPEYQIAKYSYSNLTDEILDNLFKNSSNAGARLRQPMISSESFVVGAFDIGWEGYSFDDVDNIVSTGHLLKLINDKINSIAGDGSESISEHANKKATTTVLGHTYITDSAVLTSVTEANRSYTAASVKALDALHTTIASEYKQYISDTVLGGEVTENSLDTIKELSEWIVSHGKEAADLISQFNTHEKLQGSLTSLGHAYLAQTKDEWDSIKHQTEKAKLTAVSAYTFFTYTTESHEFMLNSANSYAEEVARQVASSAQNNAYAYAGQVADKARQDAYAYAGQVASTTQNNAYAYAVEVASAAQTYASAYAAQVALAAQTYATGYAVDITNKARQDAYSYADTVANKIVEVALSWQII